MQFIPLFDRILARPEREQVSDAGVYIPQNGFDRSQVMTVISAGDGKCDNGEAIKIVVSSGDRVLVSKYAGSEVIIDNEKHYIFKQCDILGKVKG